MLWVDGFRFGRRTRFAFDQSTNAVLSCVSQKTRSCASDLNTGTLPLTFIDLTLLTMSVACRYNPDARPSHSESKADMQQPAVDRRPKGVQARLRLRVASIGYHEQAGVKEYLLGFALRNTMLLVLSGVALIPFETLNAFEVDHRMYI